MDAIDFAEILSPSFRPLDPKLLALLSTCAADAEAQIRASIERADRFVAKITVAALEMNDPLDIPGSPMVGPV